MGSLPPHAILAVAVLAAGCAAQDRRVEIRAIPGAREVAAQDAIDRGEMMYRRGEYALAIDSFRRAVRAFPDDPRALNGLGVSYAAIGRVDLADRFYQLALARRPDDTQILDNLAANTRRLRAAQATEAGLGDIGTTDLALIAPGPAGARPTLSAIEAHYGGSPDAPAVTLVVPSLERVSLGEVRLTTSPPASSRGAIQPSTVVASASPAPVLVPAADHGASPEKNPDVDATPDVPVKPVPKTVQAPPTALIGVGSPSVTMPVPSRVMPRLPEPVATATRSSHAPALSVTIAIPPRAATSVRPVPIRRVARPTSDCRAAAVTTGYEAAAVGADFVIFTGDYAPVTLRRSGLSIALPVTYLLRGPQAAMFAARRGAPLGGCGRAPVERVAATPRGWLDTLIASIRTSVFG